jgi:hypothetical protein
MEKEIILDKIVVTPNKPKKELDKNLGLNINRDKLKKDLNLAIQNNDLEKAKTLTNILKKSETSYSTGTESLRSALGSAAFEFGDEVEAAARTLFRNQAWDKKDYYSIRDDLRAKQKQFAEDNPKLALATKIGGGLATGFAGAAKVAAPSILKSMGIGSGYGATAGAGLNEDPSKIGIDTLQGGILGGAFSLPFSVAGRVLSPKLDVGVREFQKQGGRVTPGQAIGGTTKTAEEMLENLPIISTFVKGTKADKLRSMNTASMNKALEPIKVKINNKLPLGQQIKQGQTEFNKIYDDLLENVTVDFDDVFNTQGINLLEDAQKNLPPSLYEKFAKLFSSTETSLRYKPTGQQLKSVEETLKKKLMQYKSGTNADDQMVADYADDLLDLFLNNMERQNPKFKIKLRNANQAYKNWVRIETAASKTKGTNTPFTAESLSAAVKKSGFGASRSKVATRDAPMQKFADITYDIFGKNTPDSGTAPRAGWLALMAGLAGKNEYIDTATAIAGSSLLAPYTKLGGKVTDYLIKPKQSIKPFGITINPETIGDNFVKYSPLSGTSGLLGLEKGLFE